MGPYPIELTTADVVASEEMFRRQFMGLLGCTQLTVLPPFPGYDLLSQCRTPRPVLRAVNGAVLSRRPAHDSQQDWLLLPLILDDKVIGLLLAEEVEPGWGNPDRFPLLEGAVKMCLGRLQAEKQAARDAETSLWRRQALVQELRRAVGLAERGVQLQSRRLLSDGEGPAHFILVCVAVTPAPEPWAGAGPFWARVGPRVLESLSAEAMAAHLGGGYLGVFWPRTDVEQVKTWTARLFRLLGDEDGLFLPDGERWSLGAGMVSFPEDFYDVGPMLPWEKGAASSLAAAEEIIRRAILATETARARREVEILSYNRLREEGVVPHPESPAMERLGHLLKGQQKCALLMVKLDEWKNWQYLQGPRAAGSRANLVLDLARSSCQPEATVEWAGPDRFVIFLPGADLEAAQEWGTVLRSTVQSKLGTTVTIGMSAHPCPGFVKGDVLENARKALVHAGFFGPNTQIPVDAVSLNIHGDRLFEAGQLEGALQEFRRALVLDPNNANVRNSLGVCYAQMGRMEEAVAEFSQVIAGGDQDFMPHFNLGCALLHMGREEEAGEAFSRAAELEPGTAEIWFQLARLRKRQARPEEGLRHLRRAVQLKSDWMQAWRLLGEWLLGQGDSEEAMYAFQKALRLDGADAGALSGLAVAYARTDTNLEVALSLAKRSVELEPENPLFLQRLAELLYQSSDLEGALVHCERLEELVPEGEQSRRLREKIRAAQRSSTS